MKIGIDSRAANWYRGTGIGTYTYQLLNCLNKIDIKNDYLLFLPNNCNLDIDFKTNYNKEYIPTKTKENFWADVNIPNIIKDKNLDLYHVPQNGVGLPKNKDCPFVITLHDVIPYRMPQTVSDRYLKIFNEKLPKLIPLCDGIITVSNFSKQDIIRAFNYPKDKIYVTYLAAENIYRPLSKVRSRLLIEKKYKIFGDYILYVGGFSPRKNIIGLIKSFSKLKSIINNDIKLVIAGKHGFSYSKYKLCAKKYGVSNSVIFPGFIAINDLPYLYSAANLFVYPSFYEGFGLPVIESMACATPVITSNVTSMPEIVGNSAITINPYDVDELADSMHRVLMDSHLRNSLINKGLFKSRNLNWKKTAKNTLDAYTKIISKNS